uniref:Uncharacterized protein n=1 Tax=viral metagenome TaxID=1070528 RepID=A0A6C0K8W8_9ZZZZ
MTQIYINASDVAACIGDNRWKSPEDVVRSQWEKHNLSEDKINTKDYMFDAGTVEKLVRAHGNVEQLSQLREIRKQVEHELATAKRTKKDHQNTLDGKLKILSRRRAMVDESDSTPQEKACMITDIVSEETLVVGNTSRQLKVLDKRIEIIRDQNTLDEAMVSRTVVERMAQAAVDAPNAAAVTAQEKATHEVLSAIVPGPQMAAVAEATRTHVNTERGKVGEEKILNAFEKESNVKIGRRNDKLHYLRIELPSGGKVLVGGRIDGFVEATSTLVEVKRRRNRLLGFPKYEKIQCEVYLRMLGLERCTHVEDFDGTRKSRDYAQDPALWEHIQKGLAEFAELHETMYHQLG